MESNVRQRLQVMWLALAVAVGFMPASAQLNAPSEQAVLGPVVHAVDPLPPLVQFCTTTRRSSTLSSVDAMSVATNATRSNFDGLSESDGPLRGTGQADTSGSAGRSAFGEVINAAIGFFDKQTGDLLCPAQPTAAMWRGTSCAITAISDAVLKYDSLAHRWLVSRPGGPIGDAHGSQCIAISQGEDPTGAWFRYQFPLSVPGISAFGDYPKIGIWSNSYTFSARGRTTVLPTDTTILGDYAVGFDRFAMLAGEPAAAVEFFITQVPSPVDSFHFLPASDEGASRRPEGSRIVPVPFVERFSGQSDQLAIWDLLVRWTDPERAQFVRTGVVHVGAYTSDVPSITQPAIDGIPSQKLLPGLRAGSVVLEQPLIYRRIAGHESIFGNLTTAFSSTAGIHAGILWFELRKSAQGWYVFEQGIYAPPDGNDRWLASLNVDQYGDLGMMFNIAGPAVFPSLRYTSRSRSDPPGMLRQEASLVEGGGSQVMPASSCMQDSEGDTACSFGDYSQASIDPIDGCTFWMAGEYYPNQDQASIPNFSTRIGSFRLPRCARRGSGDGAEDGGR
jgi:hypothetical protein